jgi:tetratricopeptide (TPR) repeat protein
MRIFVAAGALVILGTAVGQAQEESWKGKTIIIKAGSVPYFAQDADGPPMLLGNLRHLSYKVLDDKDGKVRVSQAGLEGWADKKDLLPMDKALGFFSGMIRDNPEVAHFYSRRAAIYRYLGDIDKALADQDDSIRLDPGEPAYWNNRGITHAGRRDYDKAIDDYNAALRLKPMYSLALRNRGMAWISKKDYDKAMLDFGEALQLDPRDPTAHSGRGSAFAGKKQYVAAVASFEDSLRIDPLNMAALNSWAWLLATCPDANIRNGPKAVELAKKAIDLAEGKAAGILDTLAAAQAEVGQFQEAVRLEEQALADKNFAQGNDAARRRLKLYQEKKAYRE